MDRKSIISGYSINLPFADNASRLITNLKKGERVKLTPWFKCDDEAITCGFSGNKLVAKLEHVNDSALDLLYCLINDALAQAMLEPDCLSGNNVRVYLTGIGPRIDGLDFKAFYDHNDIEDVALTSSITNLHAANMSQDTISCGLARKFKLKYFPPNLNCTSNSALTAIHLGSKGIEQGGIDLALIINISKIKTQDIWFLSSQSMLESEIVQPFGVNSKGVIFAEGYSVMLLESDSHRRTRMLHDGIQLQSVYNQINASRSNDAAWQSASLLKLIGKILNETGIELHELCAFIPHANGSAISDGIEAKAISMLTVEHCLPLLAYKGQIGYTATGSGLIDLIIGNHSLIHNELIIPPRYDEIISDVERHFLVGSGIIKHDKHHLMKIGIGVDGSVIAVMLTNTSNER